MLILNNSFLDDKRFKDHPGFKLCNRLREEMGNDPKHNLSVESALEFVNFYGVQGTIDAEDPWLRLLSQEAVRAIDLSMLDGYTLKLVKD